MANSYSPTITRSVPLRQSAVGDVAGGATLVGSGYLIQSFCHVVPSAEKAT